MFLGVNIKTRMREKEGYHKHSFTPYCPYLFRSLFPQAFSLVEGKACEIIDSI